jgi:hypothetical protein
MKRKPVSKRVRFSVFARDQFTCVYCGQQPPAVMLEIEHVIPVSQGGTNDEANLRCSCRDCNAGKGARTIEQAVPTEAARLSMAQEMVEQRAAAEVAVNYKRKVDDLRQICIDAICEACRSDTCHKRSASVLYNLVQEFGAETAFEWLHIAKDHTSSELKMIKYLCGIARNNRERQEGGDE